MVKVFLKASERLTKQFDMMATVLNTLLSGSDQLIVG
jgi:hypothetical protein